MEEMKILMMNNPWILTATATTLLISIFLFFTRKSSKMVWPAGPKTLPIIGNMHLLGGTALQVVLHNLAKVHGSVMTIWIGSWRPVIVVSDIERAWEVLVNKSSDYSARDMPDITKIISADWKTISTSDSGPHWTNLRKGLQNVALSPHNLAAQFQFQEKDMTKMIQTLQEEARNNNGIVKPLDHMKKATLRLISRLVFGQDFNNDKYVDDMHLAIEELIRVSGYARLAEAFYYAKYLPSHKKAVREVEEAQRRVQNLVSPFLSLNPPTNTYLHFLRSQKYDDEVIIFAIFEAYLLGVDSTSLTTAWALAFLIRESNVQEKLYQELESFASKMDRKILKVEDINKLQYLQAVIKETMRMKPIAPLAIPHKACRDTSLMGKKIDKGTRVMVNIYALHHNKNVFNDPFKFMPERFMKVDSQDANGKAMEQSLLPFSAGMRICAGMELGKLQFSFALANLAYAFKWSCVADGVLPDMSDQLGFVLLMKTPLEARINRRN
uniref:Stylopine synthase n=1 Tax=Eschscholzia californica TaxID=3467 RepID=C3SBS2_ESCCA|nr:stylopine synthase [Eschscholzia californica]ANY58155.1 CYP719A2 [synthetic construct]